MEQISDDSEISNDLLGLDLEGTQKQLEYQRALEVVNQILSPLVEECILCLPMPLDEKIKQAMEEITKFLSLHHVQDDHELIDYIHFGLKASVNEYSWKNFLKQNMIKRWSVLMDGISRSKPSAFYPKIDELVSNCYNQFSKLLQILANYLMTTPLKFNIFPQITNFDAFFIERNQDLRARTKKLKIQLKLCPGVEPPILKRVQIETFETIKKSYTEWNTFTEEETIEIEKDPSCLMVPFVHRMFSMMTESKISVVSYYAPVGWEVTRVNAYVVDGYFKSTIVKRSVCRENKAMVEIEVFYPKITRELVWCLVRMEGVISRKRTLDVRIPNIKDIIVVQDEYGEHELPEGIIDADDLE